MVNAFKDNKLELLAPAKDKNCAICAIEYGADAIYIGAGNFGARKGAANSLDDIKEVVNYAHKFFARVYVTINTILKDEELGDVQKLLYELWDAGVDGIIVQDFAIFNMDLPPFLISASTQCDIRDKNKVKFFENLGLDRVILARELSLEQIREITSCSNIEVETFVFGALCVSYSGQCYLSAKLGSRSANRGECAQPCRKKYTLVNNLGKVYAKDMHLLSLKDFCALPYLDDLVDAGVVSFKIEGRLKDENYIKNVVSAFNLALKDRKRISSGKVNYDFIPDVNKTFNRGFCTYFLDDKNKDIFNFKSSGHIGEKLGKVVNVTNKYIDVKTSLEINPQDGLCYFDKSVFGFLVNRVEKNKDFVRIYPNKELKNILGKNIFRNFDSEFDSKLKKSKTKRQIRATLFVNSNEVKIVDEDLIELKMPFGKVEFANNPQKSKEIFINQMKKTGQSDFYFDEIIFQEDKIPFLKISEINSLRRELFEKLMQKRLDEYNKKCLNRPKRKISPSPYPCSNNDYRLNVHNNCAKEFYKKCSLVPEQMSFESLKNIDKAELMRTKHCIRRALNMCLKDKKTNTSEKLFLINENNDKLELFFDCKNCEMVVKKA